MANYNLIHSKILAPTKLLETIRKWLTVNVSVYTINDYLPFGRYNSSSCGVNVHQHSYSPTIFFQDHLEGKVGDCNHLWPACLFPSLKCQTIQIVCLMRLIVTCNVKFLLVKVNMNCIWNSGKFYSMMYILVVLYQRIINAYLFFQITSN